MEWLRIGRLRLLLGTIGLAVLIVGGMLVLLAKPVGYTLTWDVAVIDTLIVSLYLIIVLAYVPLIWGNALLSDQAKRNWTAAIILGPVFAMFAYWIAYIRTAKEPD